MASHRYWRVVVSMIGNASYTNCARLELRASVGGANLAVAGNGTASALSFASVGNEANKATDGNDATGWLGAMASDGGRWWNWIAWDFGAGNEEDIVEVGWVIMGGRLTAEGPRLFHLESSDDGTTWTGKYYLGAPASWSTGVLYLAAPKIADPLPDWSARCPRPLDRWHEIPVSGPAYLRVRDSVYGSFMRAWTGDGYIAGTVTADGAQASRPVFLFHRATGVFVAKTISAEDGSYRFDGINANEIFLVVATDADVDEFNAACADIITPATE